MAAAVPDTIDRILDIGNVRSIDALLTNRFNGIFENSYDLATLNFKPNAFVYMVYSALLTLPSTNKMVKKNIEGILVNKGRSNLKVIISYGTEDDTFKLKCINFDAQIVPKFEPWSSTVIKEAYRKMKMWKKFHIQPSKFKEAFTEMHHVTFNHVTVDETTHITVSTTKSKIDINNDFITSPGSGNNFVQITPIIGVPSWRANIEQLKSTSIDEVKTSGYALVKTLITQYHMLFWRAKLSPMERNFGFFVIGSLELNWAQSSHLRIKPLTTNLHGHEFSEIMINHDPPLKPWISTDIPIVVKFIRNTATDDLSARTKIPSLATSTVKDEKFIVVGIDFDRLIANLPKYTGQLWEDLPTYTSVQEVENRPIKNFVHELLNMNFQYDAHRMMPELDRLVREQNKNEERGFQSYFLGELMSYDEQRLVKYVYHHDLLREAATTFTFKVEGSDRGILIDILKWPDNRRMDENTKQFVKEYIDKIAPVDKLNMKKVTRLVIGPIQKGITYMDELDTVDYADVQKQLTGFWENVATVNPDALLKYFEDSEEGFQRMDNKHELHTMLSILKKNLFQYKGVMSSADIGHFFSGIFSERKKIIYEDFIGVMKDDDSPMFFSIVDAPYQDHDEKLTNKMNEIVEKYLLEYTHNEFRRKTDFISIAHDNDDAEFSLSKLTSYGSRKSVFESCITRVKRSGLVKCGGFDKVNDVNFQGQDFGIKAKIKVHLDVVGKVSKFLMQAQIFKDMISALIRGDYKSFALSTAFLTMGPLMESLSTRIAAKGASLGASVLGKSIIFAAPLMARLPVVGFIGYDLIQQIRDYKNGNSDARVNIAGDSTILAIEFTMAGVEGAEALGLVAGVADFLGPVGLAIGTAIFIGVDIYSSVKTVSKIGSLVQLTAWQKFTTGFLSFLNLQSTETVREEMHEQMAFDTSMQNAARFFRQHPSIRYYIFPSYQSNGEFVGDNYIDLTKNMSKNVPKSGSDSNVICSDSSRLQTAVPMHVLNCRRAFGYENPSNDSSSAFIMLANGTGTAVTFIDEPTVFLIGNGVKFVTGSLRSDTFILNGELTVGYLNGHSGRNILNIAEYAKKRENIVVDMLNGHVEFDHTYLEILEIHNLIGRPFLQELVQCHCETNFLDTQGGVNNTHPDDITIADIENCTYEMSIKLHGHVTVHNNAPNGEFRYFTSSAFDAHFSFMEGSNAGHIFFLDHFVHELESVAFTGLGNQSTYNITFKTNSSILNLWNIHQNVLFIFKEKAHLTISNSAITVFLTSNHTVDMIQDMYFDVANRLNAVLSVYSTLSNISLLFGSGMSIYHNFSSDINHINMLPSDPSHVTYLIGGSNQNVFRISTPSMHSSENGCSDFEPMLPVTIFNYANEKYSNVIDLFEIILLIREKFGGKVTVKLSSTVSDMTIHLMAHCSTRSISLINITLNQAHKNSAFQKVLINMRRPTKIVSDFDHMFLRPLDYDVQYSSYILIRNDLVEPFTTIKSTKIIGQYETFTLNNTSLILTNKNYVNKEQELIVILLENFFVDKDMQTLRLSFEDRTIRIIDEMENFRKSSDFDDPFTDIFTSS